MYLHFALVSALLHIGLFVNRSVKNNLAWRVGKYKLEDRYSQRI
jgi:hypothetical protein